MQGIDLRFFVAEFIRTIQLVLDFVLTNHWMCDMLYKNCESAPTNKNPFVGSLPKTEFLYRGKMISKACEIAPQNPHGRFMSNEQ